MSLLRGKTKLRRKKSISFPLSCVTSVASLSRLLLIPVRAHQNKEGKKKNEKDDFQVGSLHHTELSKNT